MTCTGVILAGGGATRFGGEPKGLERVAGRRIIDRVAAALREVTDELLLVANAEDAASWLPGVRVARDVREGAGALGGLHAALTHAGTEVLLVAWDMPFVSASLLGELRRVGEGGALAESVEGGRPGGIAADDAARAVPRDAVLPESEGSRRGVEPLCAWYSPRCLPAIDAALTAGDLRVIGFHAAVTVQRLPLERVQLFGDPRRLFANVNTRDELVALDPSRG
ncbi:MAG: molybdenum cofactor guanylyltransferase [Gemmatimonadaceae bacterium]|nr:molybdenum cofactor guanylyltransferase [Gemmatimonadaceae bacterium]